MKVLGIDTTADDTCAAVIEDGRKILSNIVFSQSRLHEKFGGIVPQIASFEHLKNILPSVEAALNEARAKLSEIDLFSVGLAPDPALNYYFISLDTAKVFSKVFKKPLVGVDHMEGHIFANFPEHPDLNFPFVALTVAGGHTILSFVKELGQYEILGKTKDDAAGEAFDKAARILGLGYPGGPAIDRAADLGNPYRFALPRPMINDDSLSFSYSGLKTAVWRLVNELKRAKNSGEVTQHSELLSGLDQQEINDVAASFRQAAVEVLVEKLFRAGHRMRVKAIVLGGGVAANKLLREMVTRKGETEGFKTYLPSPKLCTDNAVGTAVAGYHKFRLCGDDDPLTLKHFREEPLLSWRGEAAGLVS